MEHDAGVEDRPTIRYVHDDLVAAICTRCFDSAVRVERRADTKCIPCTVGMPPSPGRMDPVRCQLSSERVRHAKRGRPGVQDERMRVMESLPSCCSFIHAQVGCARHFFERGCPAEFDKKPVGSVAERNVNVVHSGTIHA